ncbi:MAG TPA: hypothetical protein VGI93_16100 [Steroidobacteraceae bacterium]
MRRLLCKVLGLLLLSMACASAYMNERLVLIASADSPIDQLDSIEVRRLFLGMNVTHDGIRLRALLNEADSQVRSVFLQNVVAMTDTVYDRRVLRLAMAGEITLPPIYTDKRALLAAVAANKTAISYAWERDVQQDKRIKILRTLWHD